MTRFEQDEDGAWVAHLECGHRRHVRHEPPFAHAPWILDPAARAARVGQAIECVRCDRGEPPDDPA